MTEPGPVDYTMDLGSYAEQRAALGVKTANDFGVVQENTSGFPDAADLMNLNSEQLAATGFGQRRFSNNGYTPRERGIDASLVESIGGVRGRGNVNPNNTTE